MYGRNLTKIVTVISEKVFHLLYTNYSICSQFPWAVLSACCPINNKRLLTYVRDRQIQLFYNMFHLHFIFSGVDDNYYLKRKHMLCEEQQLSPAHSELLPVFAAFVQNILNF